MAEPVMVVQPPPLEDDDADCYPLRVDYCGICTMPPEYCEYSSNPARCHEWMKIHLPGYYSRLVEKVGDEVGSLAISGDKKQTRGGKGIKKPKKKEVTPSIKISKQQRTKRKMVTVINGLKTCDIDLKKASKQFATRFSCGSSVTGEDEIVIQGDVIDEALEYITDSWPEIDEDCITIVRGKK